MVALRAPLYACGVARRPTPPEAAQALEPASPKLAEGEVTFLEVKALTPVGAFVDWGLPKELLVPFAEQTRELHVGERHAIGLYRDSSGRSAGTMRVSELLDVRTREWKQDEWVLGEAWRNDPEIGLFVIVLRAFVGLVPAQEPHRMRRGDAGRFRVANILPDGKIELSLRGLAKDEVLGDAQKILAALEAPVPARIGDKSTPGQIHALFGISKKAFKRAVGHLLKRGLVEEGDDGVLCVRRR